ncbi:MAG: hypothetical protein H7X92_14515 [Chitinophagales bacterium]|nr:hypothetical protein [Hyphomicrobiales bacterium]
MSFKSCRKCGYDYIPSDYDHCPKCHASLRAGRTMRKLVLLFAGMAGLAAMTYFAVVIAPRMSIVIN